MTPAARQRLIGIGSTAAPILLAVVLYWPGLMAWFQKDDFVWLSLRNMVHNWHDLRWALFAPLSQGTIRTLSERSFFMLFSTVFGVHAFPFRCYAFLTFASALVLLNHLCGKLTGSRAVGYWAAILWVLNSNMATALSWTSVYYELLCGLVFLIDLWLLQRWVETGERRYYWAQCATFVLGFGVLELNVVYPALAAAYVLCRAPRLLRKILPLFVLSAAYTAIHIAAAPLPATGPYKAHWDWSVFSTFGTYWKMSLGPSHLILFHIYPSFGRSSLTVLLSVGLIGFLICKIWRRQWLPVFFAAWFVIVLSPLLGLRDHINDSYLTVPLIGLAMWGASALVSAWQSGMPGKIAAVALLAIYAGVNAPLARWISWSFYDESQQVRRFVLDVVAAAHANPQRAVFLKNVDAAIFWDAVYNHPFRLYGIAEPHLLPEDRTILAHGLQLGDTAEYFASDSTVRSALARNSAVVLDMAGRSVRDITAEYTATARISLADALAPRVDVGDPVVAGQLGPTWYPNEGGYRWMPKTASVTLRGPRTTGEKLYLSGSCPTAILSPGPLELQIRIDGEPQPPVLIRQPGAFSFDFALPARLVGQAKLEVAIELSRTIHLPNDTRDLGLPFGIIEIH